MKENVNIWSNSFTSSFVPFPKQALWFKPDDQFCTEMLTLALADESRHGIDPIVESRSGGLFI